MGSIVAIVQLIGAILFSIGSACFVWMAWADEWVLPLRLGCGLWIGGCVPYTFLAVRGSPARLLALPLVALAGIVASSTGGIVVDRKPKAA